MAQKLSGTHEDFSRVQEFETGTDRSFGLTFAGLAIVAAVWSVYHGRLMQAGAIFLIGALFAFLGIFFPRSLALLNKTWMRLSHLLSKIMNPIVMGLLFYVILTPFAILTRWIKGPPLTLKPIPNMKSYWVTKKEYGPPQQTMRNQF